MGIVTMAWVGLALVSPLALIGTLMCAMWAWDNPKEFVSRLWDIAIALMIGGAAIGAIFLGIAGIRWLFS